MLRLPASSAPAGLKDGSSGATFAAAWEPKCGTMTARPRFAPAPGAVANLGHEDSNRRTAVGAASTRKAVMTWHDAAPSSATAEADVSAEAEGQAPVAVEHAEGSFINSRGNRIVTHAWRPAGTDPRGLVLLLHGYSLNSSTYFKRTVPALVSAGYAVFGLDFEGHGRSEGARAQVGSLDLLVDDCIQFFRPLRDAPENCGKPAFTLGESMGTGVALLLHEREPALWAGTILMAPMHKICDSFAPPPLVHDVMPYLIQYAPTWPIVPTPSIVDVSVEDPELRAQAHKDPLIYHGLFRAGTIAELAMKGAYLVQTQEKVSVPFLVLHGEADAVCDIGASRAFHLAASSADKTLKAYPGMQHLLVEGAPEAKARMVLKDIVDWLDEHSS